MRSRIQIRLQSAQLSTFKRKLYIHSYGHQAGGGGQPTQDASLGTQAMTHLGQFRYGGSSGHMSVVHRTHIVPAIGQQVIEPPDLEV